jgi:hypothetical protein
VGQAGISGNSEVAVEIRALLGVLRQRLLGSRVTTSLQRWLLWPPSLRMRTVSFSRTLPPPQNTEVAVRPIRFAKSGYRRKSVQ